MCECSCVGSLLYNVVLSFLSSFTIILLRKRELVAFLVGVWLSVFLLHSAVGWSSQCCGLVFTVTWVGLHSNVGWSSQCPGFFFTVPWVGLHSAPGSSSQCGGLVFTVPWVGFHSAVGWSSQ